MATNIPFLTPVLVLIIWTMVMWFWMYATRIPAMQKAKMDMSGTHPDLSAMDALPANVRAVADNYNHLHEQPVIFYAIMFFAALTGGGDYVATWLAWGYVGLRIAHSLVQVVLGNIMLRFTVFSIGSFVLFALVIKEALRIFA